MKTIGIIGGMGPEASADLFLKILQQTKAKKDQEHIPMLLDSNTCIPDRTAAIIADGTDPRPELIRSAKRLQAAGADFLIMSCNTAHYFAEDVLKEVSIPFIHMPRETAREARRLGYQKVALLATSGTIQSGVYRKAFEQEAPDIELLTPEGEHQQAVMDLIYEGIKRGRMDYPRDGIRKTVETLTAQGAECFILGCTELPIAFSDGSVEANTIDPTLVLARAAVVAAGAPLKDDVRA